MEDIMKFFILGLPRSRTYWLSEFLECLHEGFYYYPNYREFMESDNMGDSTTCYHMIKDFIKDEKKVIIHRDVKEVEESIIQLFGNIDTSFLIDMEKELKEAEGLHVNFEDINSRIEEIWDFCREDIFPKERFDRMENIILENNSIIKEVKSCLG